MEMWIFSTSPASLPQVNQGIFNHREEAQREVKRAATFDIDLVRVNLARVVGANS
jgi:hypothetical protein